MGHLVFVILQLRVLRIQLAVSVLLLAVLLIRGLYWRCRGRNPYVYGFLWMLPLVGLFAGKWKLFEANVFQDWEVFFWTIFDEISVLGVAYWSIAGSLCLAYCVRKRRLLRRRKDYRFVAWLDVDDKKLLRNNSVPKKREVRASDLLHSPYTVGIFNPYIVLPADYESRYDEEELDMVLLHEITHIRCHHNLFFVFASILKCAFWLNPVIHYSARIFQMDMEIFCDGIVAGQRNFCEYGKLILKSAMGEEAPVGILQKVNFSFSRSECRSRIVLLSGYKEAFRRGCKTLFGVLGILAVLMSAIVVGGSRLSVTGGNGIEAVFVVDDADQRSLAQITLSEEDVCQVLKKETSEAIVIDTKVLREKIRKQGYEVGVAGINYDAYCFGPGISGMCRVEAACSLYYSSNRYVTLEKKVTGWKRWVRYL